MLLMALLTLAFGGTASAEEKADETAGPDSLPRELPLTRAAYQTMICPEWNSFQTGEKVLGVVQAAADIVAVVGMGLGLGVAMTSSADGDLVAGAVFMAGAGTAVLNRVISLPLNLASTYQYNAGVRAARRAAGKAGQEPELEISVNRGDDLWDRGPGNTQATLRHLGLGFGVGNVDGFAAEHEYWDASLGLKGRHLSVTVRYRQDTPTYYFREKPGEWRMEAHETSDYSLIPEYIFDLTGGWYAKAGLGLSATHFRIDVSSERAESLPDRPRWDPVWRVEPAATFGRGWWDNKISAEISLGLTAWDSRYAEPDERDRLAFGWGAPVEPALRVFYWL